MSVSYTLGYHNIDKIDIVPRFRLGKLEYVDIRFFDADREDDDDAEEVTVWAARRGDHKDMIDVRLDDDRVGIICTEASQLASE